LEILIAFGIAAFFSFIGSVFLGLVNAAVIDTAITKSEKSALWLAFGGVLPEIPYTLIAILGSSYVGVLENYKLQLSISMGIIFILMGTNYVIKKRKKVELAEEAKIGAFPNFAKGLILAMANPQLIFYWSGYLILFQTGTFTNGKPFFSFSDSPWDPTKWSFALGASAGAFLILFIYIKLSTIYKDQLTKLIGDKFSHIIGALFIGIGLFTIIKNVI
jgi:threonine/homoserine/homoserine lactone efflux protein